MRLAFKTGGLLFFQMADSLGDLWHTEWTSPLWTMPLELYLDILLFLTEGCKWSQRMPGGKARLLLKMWLWPLNLGSMGFFQGQILDPSPPHPHVWQLFRSRARTCTLGEGLPCQEVKSGFKDVLALCAEGCVTKAWEGCFDCSLTCKCQAEILLQFLNATFRRVYCFPP